MSWRAGLALTLACAGWACAQGARGGYSISGVVVDARSGAPIAYCRVRAARVNENGGARRIGTGTDGQRSRPMMPPGSTPFVPAGERIEDGAVTADAHGRFVLPVEGAGAWRLTANARGYRAQSLKEHEGFSAAVVLTAAAPTHEVRMVLSANAMLTGTVLDEAGEPVRNAQVYAVRTDRDLEASGGGRFYAGTDDRGEYALESLPPGEYRVHVDGRPWYAVQSGLRGNSNAGAAKDPSLDVVYPETWYPAAMSEDGAETLRLEAGDEREADFHLVPLPAGHLAVGSVGSGEGGGPGVTLRRVSGDGNGFTQGMGAGRDVSFGSLTPGVYDVQMPDGTGHRIEIRAGQPVVSLEDSTALTTVTVQVDGGDEGGRAGVQFVEEGTGRRVGMQMFGRLRNRDAEEPQRVALAPGTYTVVMGGRPERYVSGLEAVGGQVAGNRLTVGTQAVSLTVHMAEGRGTVTGRVTGADGRPVEGAMVLLVPATLGTAQNVRVVVRDESNTDGSFAMNGVIPGGYILVALDGGWGVRWQDAAVLLPYLAKGVAVRVDAGGHVTRDVVAEAS